MSWEQLQYDANGIYNLHYGLIHQGLSSNIDIKNYSLPTIRPEFIPNTYSLCQEGDIVFADASEDTNDVGKAVEFIDCNGKKIVCGLHTIHGRDKANLTVKGFKSYLFKSSKFRHQIRKLAQGTKVFSISPKTFNECYVDVPSKDEQMKITALLFCIENKIDIERKLLFQYQSQKQYLLQNLFI